MLIVRYIAAFAGAVLVAAPAGEARAAAPQTCSSSGGSSCGGSCGGGSKSCSSAKPASLIEKIRGFPDSTWDEARREVEAENPLARFELETFGPRPPSDPKQYAEALSTLLGKPASALFSFAAYGGELPAENVGSESKLGEASMRMASMQIDEPIATVYTFYSKSFESQGLRARGDVVGDNGAYFSFRASDGFLRTVTLVEIDGSTMVFVGVGDPSKIQKASAAFISDWPMLPTEGEPLDLSQSEGASLQLNRYARVRATSRDEVVNFYKRELPPLGWRLEPAAEVGADVKVAVFVRGEQRCTVVVSDGDAQHSMMNVMCIVQR